MLAKKLEPQFKNHFQLHFEPEHYVLYQDEQDGLFKRNTIQNIQRNAKYIKRIQYNTQKYRKYIIIDIDSGNDLYEYRKHNLPEPNFILWNGKDNFSGGHLFYVLNRTIINNEKSQYYVEQWKKVFKYFTLKSGGDKNHQGFIGKNVYNDWNFIYKEFEIEEYDIKTLLSYVKQEETIKIDKIPVREEKEQKTLFNYQLATFSSKPGSRNNDLFNTLRFFAYAEIKRRVNKPTFRFTLQIEARRLNNLILEPLDDKELFRIIASITQYCLDNWNYIENYTKRGIMCLNDDLTIKEKQKLGAKYTNEQQKLKTKLKIEKAILEMQEKKLKINLSTLEKYTKITRKTLRNYKDLLK